VRACLWSALPEATARTARCGVAQTGEGVGGDRPRALPLKLACGGAALVRASAMRCSSAETERGESLSTDSSLSAVRWMGGGVSTMGGGVSTMFCVRACACVWRGGCKGGREREWIEADGKIVLERQCGRTGRHIGLACKRASRMLACDLAREPADRVIVLRVVFGLAERRAHLRRGRPQLKSVR
jgi:hypothetical protein